MGERHGPGYLWLLLGALNITQLVGYHRFVASWTKGNDKGILSGGAGFTEPGFKQAVC
jgi:hypothetical protein